MVERGGGRSGKGTIRREGERAGRKTTTGERSKGKKGGGREAGRRGVYLGKDALGLDTVQIEDGGTRSVPHKLHLRNKEAVGAVV